MTHNADGVPNKSPTKFLVGADTVMQRLSTIFLWAIEDLRPFKDRCLRARSSPLPYVFLCILKLIMGQTRIVWGQDLVNRPPFEKACSRAYGKIRLEPQNPYPSLRVILAEKGTHF